MQNLKKLYFDVITVAAGTVTFFEILQYSTIIIKSLLFSSDSMNVLCFTNNYTFFVSRELIIDCH